MDLIHDMFKLFEDIADSFNSPSYGLVKRIHLCILLFDHVITNHICYIIYEKKIFEQVRTLTKKK